MKIYMTYMTRSKKINIKTVKLYTDEKKALRHIKDQNNKLEGYNERDKIGNRHEYYRMKELITE